MILEWSNPGGQFTAGAEAIAWQAIPVGTAEAPPLLPDLSVGGFVGMAPWWRPFYRPPEELRRAAVLDALFKTLPSQPRREPVRARIVKRKKPRRRVAADAGRPGLESEFSPAELVEAFDYTSRDASPLWLNHARARREDLAPLREEENT